MFNQLRSRKSNNELLEDDALSPMLPYADDIISLAKANDRMGVLCAVRDEIALKLARGAGARDTASLAREMGDILDQIAELQKRSGPGRNTKLGQLLSTEEPVIPKPRTKGKGARNVTYKSKMTIDDME